MAIALSFNEINEQLVEYQNVHCFCCMFESDGVEVLPHMDYIHVQTQSMTNEFTCLRTFFQVG